MHAGALLAGVVEGLEDALDAVFVQFAINLREPQVKAYQQRTFDTVNGKVYKSTSGGVVFKVDGHAESLVVSVGDLAVRADQVEAVMRLIGPGEPVGASKDDPEL